MRLKTTGELVFVKNPDRRNAKGHVAEMGIVFGRWEGGDVFEMGGVLVESSGGDNKEFLRTGTHTLHVACMGLDLRIVCRNYWAGVTNTADMFDTYLLMPDSPRAKVLWAYFAVVLRLLRLTSRTEGRVRSLFGQDVYGMMMPPAGWLAAVLLSMREEKRKEVAADAKV